jgi:cyclopropane fatty-acyl-phospholipid synthase-like methyltransferase
MIWKFFRPKEDLGLGLGAGAEHYRAFVGPPEDYDLVAAMTFNLLTTLGLRQNHYLLDIGCGSIRIGRLFIPYLNVGHYTGIEPNRWLVRDGIRHEIGSDLVRIKRPSFYYTDSTDALPPGEHFDFAVAQSVFSHTGRDLLERWLAGVSERLHPTGALTATFLIAEEDYTKQGWVYPDCVKYRCDTMAALARNVGLSFGLLDWKHPRQSWALFAKPEFDALWFQNQPLTWNTMLQYHAHA